MFVAIIPAEVRFAVAMCIFYVCRCRRVCMPIRNTVLLMRGAVQGAASKNRSCLANFLCSSARESFTLSICVANLTSFYDVANFFDMFYNMFKH